MKNDFRTLIRILLILKCCLAFLFIVDYGSSGFVPKLSLVKKVSPDELSIADIAYNFNSGHGFTKSANSPRWGRPEKQEDIVYYKTSYRPFLPVFIHIAYQNVYELFSPLTGDDIWYNHDSLYYRIYAGAIFYAGLLFFIFSVSHFRYLAFNILRSQYWAGLATVLYILLPSTLIYVGLTTIYENLVTPMVVTVLSCLVRIVNNEVRYRSTPWLTALLTTVSVLLRPQLTPVFFFVFLLLLFWIVFRQRNSKAWVTVVTTGILVLASHAGIFALNYHIWGEAIYSTRGDAFLWGHNPYARGCWDGTFDKPGSEGFNYQVKHMPQLKEMTELEISKKQKELAVEWIKDNPKAELMLMARKTAIYFMPHNYEKISFNLFTFLVNGIFLISVLMFIRDIFKGREQHFGILLLYTVAFWVFVLNLAYFVEYRFRIFAEPAMLLLAVLSVQRILFYLSKRNRIVLDNKMQEGVNV